MKLIGRDLSLYFHLLLGIAIIVLSFIILSRLKKKSSTLNILAVLTAAISWVLLLPAARLYITFYPATKTVIKAGTWPWAHSIFMETKEHWGLLLPIIATVAAGLVVTGKLKESKKWWILLAILSILIGVMGRIVTMGGMR